MTYCPAHQVLLSLMVNSDAKGQIDTNRHPPVTNNLCCRQPFEHELHAMVRFARNDR